MEEPDTRWIQRFENFRRALQTLRSAESLSRQRELTELEQQGLIQGFEFTHELAWNVLKDYLEDQGIPGIIGSKNATREAFRNGLLENGEVWMAMIQARNETSHTYNLALAAEISRKILERFYPAFVGMEARFGGLLPDAHE